MLDSFLEAICRVGIFMICAKAIVHFRPKEADEKYIKLLVSIMILIQLFLPLGGFLVGGDGGETASALKEFKRELQRSMQEAEEDAAQAEELLEQMTLEEVRKRVEEQAQMQEQSQGQVTVQTGAVAGAVEEDEIKIQVEPVESITVGQ